MSDCCDRARFYEALKIRIADGLEAMAYEEDCTKYLEWAEEIRPPLLSQEEIDALLTCNDCGKRICVCSTF